MIRTLAKALLVVGLVGFGMLLQSVRAEPKGPLGDAKFEHIGFIVRDLDKSVKEWDAAIGSGHTRPTRGSPQRAVFLENTTYDKNTSLRVAQFELNGLSLHLLQPTGGSSPWMDHLEKYGDGFLQHICFQVKDLDVTANAFVAMGGKIVLKGGIRDIRYIEMPHLPFMFELHKLVEPAGGAR